MPERVAGIGNPQGIDVMVETDMELVREEMGNIIFADVQFLFKQGKRQVLLIVPDTVGKDFLQRVRVARHGFD